MKNLFNTVALLCLCLVGFSSAPAQTEDRCLTVKSMTARCGDVSADGKQYYIISFQLTDIVAGADLVYISSNTGHVGSSTFVLPFANPVQQFKYLPVTSKEKACFSISVYKITDDGRRRLCRVEHCIELPKCNIKCEDVRIKLRSEMSPYAGTEDVVLNGILSLAPAGLEWFTINVVEAKHITRCSNTDAAEWEKLKLKPTRAELSGAGAPNINPEIVSWKFDDCFRMTERKFSVLFDLPEFCPPPSDVAVKCVDTAIICVKYAYKLCNGPRCDTTVCYTVIRRCESKKSDVGIGGRIDLGLDARVGLTGQLGLKHQSEISVNPNPANSDFNVTVTVPQADPNAVVEVSTFTGVIVHSQAAAVVKGKNELSLATNALVSGVYIIRVRGIFGSVSQTIQISK